MAASRTAPRQPTPAAVLKKVAAVSDTTKQLSREIKAMGRVFADNQKVLVSMNGILDAVASSLEDIQRQSRRIDALERDSKSLSAGIGSTKGQAAIISKLAAQTARLEEQVARIQKSSPDASKLSKQVSDGSDSIRNNSQMIIKLAQRVDEVRDQLRAVSGRAGDIEKISAQMDELARSIEGGAAGAGIEKRLEEVSEKAESAAGLQREIERIGKAVGGISEKAAGIGGLEGVIDGLRRQFEGIAQKAGSIPEMSAELGRIRSKIDSVSQGAGRLDEIEDKLGALAKRADATAFAGEGIRSVQEEMGQLKKGMLEKTAAIEERIAALAGTQGKSEESSSKEVAALLRLSEFQSRIRINSESKYGGAEELEQMAVQTRELARVFESVDTMDAPQDVQQWAVSKAFDCADRWEIRFSDVFSILCDKIGRDRLKELVRTRQVRDIYGMRAVDQMRSELGIS